jgi:hypothetical protein
VLATVFIGRSYGASTSGSIGALINSRFLNL